MSPGADFVHVFNTAREWGYHVYDAFVKFGEWASRPIVSPDDPLYDFLESMSWLLNPVSSNLIEQYFPGTVDTIWDLSLLDLVIPGCIVVATYSIVRWVISA